MSHDHDDALPPVTAEFARAVGPDPDGVIEEMDARADREGFPTVGPEVGGWLAVLARLVDAREVFEFGSGFGYSAYWFARALPPEGRVVLTEVDESELDDAREYLERGGHAGHAVFEHGDALEIVEEYDGPFDVVLVDNEKHRYGEAFDAVRGKVRPGGVILADNAMFAGHIDFDALRSLLAGGDPDADEATRGIADYLERVRAAPEYETVLLPLGEGVAVSVRTA